MTTNNNPLSLCLWFNGQAEEAANYYCGIFPDASIGAISRYGKEGYEFHGMAEGTAMTVQFSLRGMRFMALNGGPRFQFNEAISIVVTCKDLAEIDHYWEALGNGGQAMACGWIKDRYGLCWQIVPDVLAKLMLDPDASKVQRVSAALLQMQKLDIAALLAAAE